MNRIPVEDRLDIQELSARYAFRCDTRRYGEVAELFTEDGVFDETIIGLPLCEGRMAIHDFFTSVDPAIDFVIHINGNHQFTAFTGDGASATTHLHVEGRFNGSAVTILGYYSDDYARVEGRWLLKQRKLVAIAPPTGF